MKAWLRQNRPTRMHLFRFLAALGLSVIVWAYVTISQNPEVELPPFEAIPLEVQGLREGLVLINAQGIPDSSLGTVTVTVRAPREERLIRSDIRAYVDLSEIEDPNTYELPVMVEVPRAVRTSIAEPGTVVVRVEEIQSKWLPIDVQLQDQPGFPYTVGTPIIRPTQAQVEGPRNLVERVVALQALLDLSGRIASLEDVSAALIALDEAGDEVREITISPDKVAIDVRITLPGGYATVSIVPRTSGPPADGYFLASVEANPNAVTIFSDDPNVLDRVRFLTTSAVDITDRSSDFTETVGLNLPPNVALINSPSRITVTVHFGAIEPQLRLQIPVRLIGLEEPLEATWDPQWLNVLVRAPLEVLQGLSLNELWANVNVAGLDAGEYDLSPIFQAPPDVEVAPAGSAIIRVVIVRPATATPTPTPAAITPTITPTANPTTTATPTLPPIASPTPTPQFPPEPTPTPTPLPSPTP